METPDPKALRELARDVESALAFGGKCKHCGKCPVDDKTTVNALSRAMRALRSQADYLEAQNGKVLMDLAEVNQLQDAVKHLRKCPQKKVVPGSGAVSGPSWSPTNCPHPAHGRDQE